MVLCTFKHLRFLEVAVERDIKVTVRSVAFIHSHRQAGTQDWDLKVQRSVAQFMPRTAAPAYLLI